MFGDENLLLQSLPNQSNLFYDGQTQTINFQLAQNSPDRGFAIKNANTNFTLFTSKSISDTKYMKLHHRKESDLMIKNQMALKATLKAQ